ncbi:MAG: septum formation protein Maf [Tidjanibacter sp.]|nr:septum formation protein Maf [Tidjanibacter sp.]
MTLLKDSLKNCRLILASNSPRRRQLLGDCGLEFMLAQKYEVEEIYPADMEAERVPEYLAGLKSDGYPEQLSDGDVLITADTVVILGDRILGKPADRGEAVEMIRALSGKSHTVVTGVVLRSATDRQSFSAHSKVTFRELRDEEIEYYVDTYSPLDKAGAYGIQEWIGYVAVEHIEGSFYNVIGLPVQRLYVELEKFLTNK